MAERPDPKARRRAILRAFRTHPFVAAVKRAARAPLAAAARWRDRRLQSKLTVELAVGAIFKNEARYLDEWLTFHHGVGFERFYLYNNNSTDDFRSVLAPWIAKGIVRLIDWPMARGQRSAYRDCIRRFRGEARWIAFIDLDEFVFSPVQTDLRPLLRSYRDLPALFVYQHMFGSSGHKTRPTGPVVEAYTKRIRVTKEAYGKSIVNPRLVRDVPNPHVFKTWSGLTLDEKREPPPIDPSNPLGAVPTYDVIRLNHYWSKSTEDLKSKVLRGDAFHPREYRLEQHLRIERSLNAEEDRTILPLWAKIKANHGRD